MSTVSQASLVPTEEVISQGDVFKDIKYAYIDTEDDTSVQIVEYTFPLAIVVSQACDVIAMGQMLSNGLGKATKFMPSILMCPIYDKNVAKSGRHLSQAFAELGVEQKKGDAPLFNSKDANTISNDWHYRFHDFSVQVGDVSLIQDAVIDFKHYFSIPATVLMHGRQKRLFRLNDIYGEQITLKFTTFLSRVAMPD